VRSLNHHGSESFEIYSLTRRRQQSILHDAELTIVDAQAFAFEREICAEK